MLDLYSMNTVVFGDSNSLTDFSSQGSSLCYPSSMGYYYLGPTIGVGDGFSSLLCFISYCELSCL